MQSRLALHIKLPVGLIHRVEAAAAEHGLGLGVEGIDLRPEGGDALFPGDGDQLADDPVADVLVLPGESGPLVGIIGDQGELRVDDA